MTCEKGCITGILGLNGAGKTTILKAITARHFATSGSVLVEGIEAGENAEQVRNLTGFVEEEPKLPGEYTVEEFLSQVFSLHQEKESHTDSEFLRNSNSKMILRSKIESVWHFTSTNLAIERLGRFDFFAVCKQFFACNLNNSVLSLDRNREELIA